MSIGDWDGATSPVDHTLISAIPGNERGVISSTRIVLAKEHVTPGASNAGGQHKGGSARIFLQSGFPTTDPEGNNLETGITTAITYDNGRVGVDTASSYLLKVYYASQTSIASGWRDVTVANVVGTIRATTGIAASGVISSLSDGTQSGQAVHVGQFDTSYIKLLTPATSGNLGIHIDTTYLATAHATGITLRPVSIDSSLMTSTVVISSPGQISSLFGSWASKSNDTSYLATTDGIVHAINSGTCNIKGYTDSNNPPTTQRAQGFFGPEDYGEGITMAVRKGDYWKVTGATTVYWLPIGG